MNNIILVIVIIVISLLVYFLILNKKEKFFNTPLQDPPSLISLDNLKSQLILHSMNIKYILPQIINSTTKKPETIRDFLYNKNFFVILAESNKIYYANNTENFNRDVKLIFIYNTKLFLLILMNN